MINEQITQITQVARLICAAQADKQIMKAGGQI